MKISEYSKELRALDQKGLQARIEELRTSINRARVDAAFGQAKSNQHYGLLRRQLAQALTIVNERTLIAEEQESK